MNKISILKQYDQKDCGPTCLKMLYDAYGLDIDIGEVRARCGTNKIGTTLFNLHKVSEDYDFDTEISFLENVNEIRKDALPAILFVDTVHFVIITKIKTKKIVIIDPAVGKKTILISELHKRWLTIDIEDEKKRSNLIFRAKI